MFDTDTFMQGCCPLVLILVLQILWFGLGLSYITGTLIIWRKMPF